MALAAPAAGHAHGAHRNRAAMNRVGLWLFFFSESVVFALLAMTRFYLKGIEIDKVDQALGLGITIILLASSVSAFTAETAIEHDRRTLASWGLFVTIALGVLFAFGVAFEWYTAEFTKDSAFGTVFFTMTGMHAFHVISGVFMLGLVWAQLLRGRYSSKDHWPFSGIVMYWHFVDIVWVFFYPALYLVSTPK
jgi:cytochrome c oxidase subunit 3